jgi:hypothetical protein
VSRFLLRCTITTACVVALSTAAAAQTIALTEPATVAPIVELTAPVIVAPTPISPVTGAPTIAAPTTVVPSVEPPQLFLRPVDGESVPPMFRRRESFGRPAVLMITGGALLLTGLLVDGDASSILIISGAAIGGYGLYLHLQSPNARLTTR